MNPKEYSYPEPEVISDMQERLASDDTSKTSTDIEVVGPEQCEPTRGVKPRFDRAARLARRASECPTNRWYKYPPAKDNPGRVSSGCARDMQLKAELHYKGTHAEVIAAMKSMNMPEGNSRTVRNKARRLR